MISKLKVGNVWILCFFPEKTRFSTIFSFLFHYQKIYSYQDSHIIIRFFVRRTVPSTIGSVLWNKIVCMYVAVRVKGTMFFWPLSKNQWFLESCQESWNINRQVYHFQPRPIRSKWLENRSITLKHHQKCLILFRNLASQTSSHRKLSQSG